MARDQRRLTAIVSADVVGYSRLMGQDESGTLAGLKAHLRELIDPKIAEYGGRTVKSMGDGLLLEFPSVVDAVRCAVDVQRGMAVRNAQVPEGRRIDFRIGINVGDIIVDGEDIFGDGVNVAARLQTLAERGGICVSRGVRDQVLDKLGFAFESLGAQEVKNIARPIEVYRIQDDPPDGPAIRPRPAPDHGPLLRQRIPGKGWRWLAAGVLAAGLAGIAAWVLVQHAPIASTQTAGAPITSLAVLPLANLSGDPGQEYFADGMTEALITELARIGALKVISRTSVMQYKGAKQSLPEIARALGVGGIIEGSVLREGDQVKITVQLISAPSDTHLWAQDYVRDLRNVLTLQSEVARAIAKHVTAALTPAETARLTSSRTVNAEAYDLYLRAKDLSGRPGNWLRVSELYEQATTKDPGYASAYGALGYSLIVAFNAGLMPRGEAFPGAQRAAQHAIELDPEDLDAMRAQIAVMWTILRDYAAAERIMRRVQERAPNDAMNHIWLSQLLSLYGRVDEAIAEARRAVELDPQSVQSAANLVLSYRAARRYDDCIDQARKVVHLEPNSSLVYRLLGECYDAKGGYEEGAKAQQRYWVLFGEDPGAAAQLVTAQAQGGYRDRVRAALAYALRMSERKSISYSGDIASYYALLGERDQAFKYLERAYQEYDHWIFWLHCPVFDSLRDDPRWPAFLRRLNLDETPMAKLPTAPAPAAR